MATIPVHRREATALGIMQIDHDRRITRFVEKPARGEAPSSWANAGTWIFEPEVLTHIPDEKMDGSLERLVDVGAAEGLELEEQLAAALLGEIRDLLRAERAG